MAFNSELPIEPSIASIALNIAVSALYSWPKLKLAPKNFSFSARLFGSLSLARIYMPEVKSPVFLIAKVCLSRKNLLACRSLFICQIKRILLAFHICIGAVSRFYSFHILSPA